MVCGVTSECSSNHRPAYDSFEPIGVLLDKVSLQRAAASCGTA